MCGIEEGTLIDVNAAGSDAESSGGSGGAGSGGGDSGGSGGGAMDVEDAGPAFVSCDEYCAKINDVCRDENAAYLTGTTEDGCLALCSHFTPEERRCRYDFIENASASDAVEECRVAGPGGQSPALPPGCGQLCENYCTLMEGECPTQRLTDAGATAADRAACVRVCNRLEPAYGGVYNTLLDGAEPLGNNVQCRIFHIGNAAAYGPNSRVLHCSHAAGVSPCR
jgi:hypothetical protein